MRCSETMISGAIFSTLIVFECVSRIYERDVNIVLAKINSINTVFLVFRVTDVSNPQ